MALKDALAAEHGKRVRVQCRTCILIAEMPPKDAEALLAALAKDSGITTASIVRALRAEGYETNQTNLARHRAGDCVK